MKRKLYIGCALTHAPEEFRQMVFKLRELFTAAGFEVLEFAWKDGPRHDVNIYEFDMGRLDEADVFVAIVDYPAIGLGIEFERSIANCGDTRKQRWVLVFAKRGQAITKIVSDCLAHHGFPPIVRYDNPEDIVFEVTAFFRQIDKLEVQRQRAMLWGE